MPTEDSASDSGSPAVSAPASHRTSPTTASQSPYEAMGFDRNLVLAVQRACGTDSSDDEVSDCWVCGAIAVGHRSMWMRSVDEKVERP